MEEREFMASYDALADALFRHCYFRLYDREEAKDAVQEAFLRAWKYAQENHIDNLRALLYRIARNVVADKWRKKKSVSLDELLEEGWEPSGREHLKIMLDAETKNLIKLLHRLDEKEREVVILRYIDGLGPEEISRVLEERGDPDDAPSPNLVSVRLNRAISRLQNFVK